jgi:hypothetical protein
VFCHSALDAESRKQGKLTKPVLLSPDAYPLDSRSPIVVEDKLHGNDGGVFKNAFNFAASGRGIEKK